MSDRAPSQSEVASRALAWTRRRRDRLCDSVQPWEHGTVLRCSRYPDWYELNCVRVEQTPGMSAPELMDFADRALGGLSHRLICFEPAPAPMALRAQFHDAGWEVHPLIWMRYQGDGMPPGEPDRVLEVSYDAVAALRETWHREDFPAVDPTEFHAAVRGESMARGVRVLAMMQDDRPVGFAELNPEGDEIEIAAVYVLPEYRGHGRGTALTAAAITAAQGADDLWICADAEGRPQHLYARLGFVPVLATVDFLRLPSPERG